MAHNFCVCLFTAVYPQKKEKKNQLNWVGGKSN